MARGFPWDVFDTSDATPEEIAKLESIIGSDIQAEVDALRASVQPVMKAVWSRCAEAHMAAVSSEIRRSAMLVVAQAQRDALRVAVEIGKAKYPRRDIEFLWGMFAAAEALAAYLEGQHE